MGYGHQRAAYPLLRLATTPKKWNMPEPVIISANNYPEMPRHDRARWSETQRTYEWISRMNGFPFFGKRIFRVMDYFQKIEPFYPRRDLSKPTLQTKQIYGMIKHGFGKHLIATLNENPLPLICSFFIPAFFAEEHGYKGEIYCVCTDTDVSRAWAPLHPEKSRITYLAPTVRVRERLKLYGVRPEKIVLTGFPLPETVAQNKIALARRIFKLDPRDVYQKKFAELLSLHLGINPKEAEIEKPLTVTFAVGGAGAQWKIGVAVLKSLQDQIKNGSVKLNLVAGSSKRILKKFERAVRSLKLTGYRNKSVTILFNENKFKYFELFNKTLIETDLLWTKPSELSFYVALGLPIIMAPSLGSHEESNKAWLHMVGGGFSEYDPRYTNEWLYDWLDSGWFAEAAMNGFLNAPKRAVEHIEDLVLHGKKTEVEDIHFI